MKQELKKYPKMKLVSIVYGNDDPATSLTVLQGLLSAYPNLRGIISPTTVGISTAAQYLDTHKSLLKHLVLTGLGLPSQMRKYVLDGTCKEFELWNPSNLGYLAGYAAASLASGLITGKAGQTFKAGKLGTYKILPESGKTGPSVVLGPPTCSTSPTSSTSTSKQGQTPLFRVGSAIFRRAGTGLLPRSCPAISPIKIEG